MGQVMRRSAAEKREIIHLVEHSALPVGRTLDELDVPRSSFYRWYRQCQRDGEKGLEPKPSKRRQFWNRLPEPVCDQIVQMALAQPEKSARQLGLALHRPGRLFRLGIKHIPAPESLRPGREPGLRAGDCRRSVRPANPASESAVAD